MARIILMAHSLMLFDIHLFIHAVSLMIISSIVHCVGINDSRVVLQYDLLHTYKHNWSLQPLRITTLLLT